MNRYLLLAGACLALALPAMASATITLDGFLRGDFNGNGVLDTPDALNLAQCLNGAADLESCRAGDFNGDGRVDCNDAAAMISAWIGPDPAPAFDSCRGSIMHSIPLLNPRWLVALTALLLLVVRSRLYARDRFRD